MRKTIFSDEHMRIVRRLRQLRLAAGLTQTDVAKRMRKPQSFVARMESGQRRIDVIELSYVAEIYGCTLADIVRDSASVETVKKKRQRTAKR